MQDGTKVRAFASGDTFRREERLEEHLGLAREQVERMEDPRVAEELGPRVAAARARAAREREERLEEALVELERIRATKPTEGEKQQARASETDPEARIMKHGGGGGFWPSYNVQLTTDAANTILVGVEVTQAATDYDALLPALERLEETMGELPRQVVADAGYTSRANVMATAGRGVDYYGSMDDGAGSSAGQMRRRGVDPAFWPSAFGYDEGDDSFRCPGGKRLFFEGSEKQSGRTNYTYRANVEDCLACPLRESCCPKNGSKGRSVVRGVEDERVRAFRAKMGTDEAKAIFRQRAGVAEFPNAWLKDKIGLRQFRLRGLAKVTMETMWACLTYNIQQWLRLVFRPGLRSEAT